MGVLRHSPFLAISPLSPSARSGVSPLSELYLMQVYTDRSTYRDPYI